MTAPAPDSPVAGLRAQYQEIVGRLAQAGTTPEREVIKRESISFFKRVEGSLTERPPTQEELRGRGGG